MSKPSSLSSSIEGDPTETSPLLTPARERGNEYDLPSKTTSRQAPERVTFLIMAVVLLLSLGDQWMDSPQTRIIESVICYRYYEKVDPSKLLVGREGVGPGAIGGVAEMDCKADTVQSELAMLRGWQMLFDGFPGLVLAIPLGWAADRFGRKPFVLAGMMAFVLRASWIQLVTWFWQSFDIRLTWLSTIFASIGGGSPVTTMLFFVVLSDITPEAGRAAIFLRVGAFNLVAGLVMPPLGAWFMETNHPWIPSLGGTLLEILAAVMYAFVPETLDWWHQSAKSNSQPPPTTPGNGTASSGSTMTGELHTPSLPQRWATEFKSSTAFLTTDWRVPALILPFCVHFLLNASTQLLIQYLSKRYALTFAKATLLLTVRHAVIVLLLFSILPYVSTAVMQRFHLSAQKKDLYLTRISQILLAMGWILVGLSPNIPLVTVSLVVGSLGQGSYMLLRSFLTSLLPADHIARVYSILSVVDTLGLMVGSPVLADLFKRGLALGGGWVGLPFYFLGLLYAGFAFLLFGVGLRKGEDEHESVDQDE